MVKLTAMRILLNIKQALIFIGFSDICSLDLLIFVDMWMWLLKFKKYNSGFASLNRRRGLLSIAEFVLSLGSL